MRRQLEALLKRTEIELWWADERPLTSDWVGVADVAVSRKRHAVAVPRRRREAYHYSEVLHEVAHLMLWERTGISPSKSDDIMVCRVALALAAEYKFEDSVVEHLSQELNDEITKQKGESRDR